MPHPLYCLAASTLLAVAPIAAGAATTTPNRVPATAAAATSGEPANKHDATPEKTTQRQNAGAKVPAAASSTTLLGAVEVDAATHTPGVAFGEVEINGASAGPQVTADSASLVRRVPGAALNNNGPLAGQIQYRGLYGMRNNVRIDGMHVNPGGPNWMDTPLHYLPRPELGSLVVHRGIAPVADGIETLGVTVDARSHAAHYTDSTDWTVQGTGMAGYGSVNDGYLLGGMLGGANDRQRFDVVAARDHGGDARYGRGTIDDSAYSRSQAGFDYGLRFGADTLSVHARYDDTGMSANPVFPMDTEFLHTALARVNYTHTLDDGHWDARLYYIHVDHAMNNYSRRATPDFNPMMAGPDKRRVPASARNWGLDVSRTRAWHGGELKFGINAYLARNSATATDPDMPMFRVHIFNRAERNLYSTWAQWQGKLARRLKLTAGARYTRVHMDAGPGQVPMMLPPPAQRLTQAFNGATRQRNDNNVDAMARLDYALDDTRSIEFSVARKTRSPSYLARYGYIPLETTAGLADGNNYVGDIGLKPEVAYQADLGLNWQGDRLSLTPRLFVSRIHNYIQGLPVDPAHSPRDADTVKVSMLNGDPTPLRFSNVQARLYGMDLGALATLSRHWQLTGTLSYTRGQRTNSHDNLYRIAPLHGNIDLAWRSENWRFALSQTFAARQDKTSRANADDRLAHPATPGYALVGLSASWRATPNTMLRLGISNVFDRTWYDALGGYNRVLDSDVPAGSHLPGHGRNVYMQLTRRL